MGKQNILRNKKKSISKDMIESIIYMYKILIGLIGIGSCICESFLLPVSTHSSNTFSRPHSVHISGNFSFIFDIPNIFFLNIFFASRRFL